MLFDTLSALAPLLSRLFTRGIIKWGIGNARDLESWIPKLRLVAQASATSGYQEIDATVTRLIYRLQAALPFPDYDTVNRFTY